MDIVSVFCFGEDIPKLDTGVFEMLMRYAVGEELTETKPVSPFPRFGMDNSPVVRSFLLQHLINSRLCFRCIRLIHNSWVNTKANNEVCLFVYFLMVLLILLFLILQS